MKNKFENLINESFIFRLMVQCDFISMQENTHEDAVKKFLELDEKFRFYRLLSALKVNGNLNNAIDYLKKQLDKHIKNEEKYDINLVKPLLRSFLAEDPKQAKQLEDKAMEIMAVEKEAEKILKPITFNNFMQHIEKKKYYVKSMFAEGTINMIFSPPKQMKSFISYYLALCMATGNDFLEQKTKKSNVCYFDWENPISDVQNRLKGICKGMKFKMNEIDNLFLFPRQHTLIKVGQYESYVYSDIKEELLNFIKENEIKVIFFDTFRRLGNFDENDSQTINTIKSELFDPLIKETNICIIFLHHTSKEGKTYRGSVDIEGILDTSFKITKKEHYEDILLTINCDARRNNEIDQIKANIEIENKEAEDEDGEMYEEIESVKFKRKEINEIEEVAEDYKQYRAIMVETLEIDYEYKNKELKEMLQNEFEIKSDRTISSILKWLVQVNILLKTGSHKATRYKINPDTKKNLGVKMTDVGVK